MALGALLVASLASTARATESTASSPSPTALLDAAFEKRFAFDVVQLVSIETTQRSSTVGRTLQMALKRIDGRIHGLGYIVEPIRLKDTRLLMIENRQRSDDFFIYMPSEDKVRRITSSRRADSFLGTGLSFEDLERRYVDEYAIADEGPGEIGGEPVRFIAARPNYESGHDIAVYAIATADDAILEARYWRGEKKKLLRILRVARADIAPIQGFLVPTRLTVEDVARKSLTTVTFTQIHVNPEIDDALFTRTAIEHGRPIPYLEAAKTAAASSRR